MDAAAFKYPRTDTLKARCLARLLRGDSLTHRSFDSEAHTYRLASSIAQLRRDGWPISTSIETADTADPTGRTAKYAVYDLPRQVIKMTGAEGAAFMRRVFAWEALRAAASAKQKAASYIARCANAGLGFPMKIQFYAISVCLTALLAVFHLATLSVLLVQMQMLLVLRACYG